MRLTKVLSSLRIAFALLGLFLLARPGDLQAQPTPLSYSHGDPSDLEQYMLELINRARIDPTTEGIFLDTLNTPYSASARVRKPEFFRNLRAEFASYPAVQPLAFNQSLLRAARVHAKDMITRGYVGHVTPEGLTPSNRAANEGFSSQSVGENFSGGGAQNEDEVLQNHFGLMVDYDNMSNATRPLGHRFNLLNSNYSEIGVGIYESFSNGKIVQDFGDNNSRFLVGVVYNDRNGNQFYDPGEGLPGVTITLSTGLFYAVTSASGGFAIPMEPAQIRNLTDPVRMTALAEAGWNDEIQKQDDAFRSDYAASNIVPATLTVTASGGSLQNPARKEISIPKLIQVNYKLYGTDNWFFKRTMFVGQNAKVDFKVGSPLTLQITSQPVSQVVSAGSTVTFNVTASGPQPLRYEWRKSGVNLANSGRISGVNTATLTIASVQTIDSGNYSVIVSDFSRVATSSSALLTVKPLTQLKLSVRVNGNEIIISWSDPAATLEEADSVTGPWKSVVGGSPSPRSLAIPANRKFYRLRKPDDRPGNAIPVPNMVSIPAGTFTMGSPVTEWERFLDETRHTVTLPKGFYLGKYEVTQGEYFGVMGNNPSKFTGDLKRPVEQVSWNDATDYCGKLTAFERAAGRLPASWVYRLPTEAEWEYACRAGTTTPFNLGPDLRSGMANFNSSVEYVGGIGTVQNSNGIWLARTTAVGSYAPNAWGLYDMHGNVFEWCLDWYGDYASGSVADPKGPTSGLFRVLRGGGWIYDARECRSAYRDFGPPNSGRNSLGFRVVLAPGQ